MSLYSSVYLNLPNFREMRRRDLAYTVLYIYIYIHIPVYICIFYKPFLWSKIPAFLFTAGKSTKRKKKKEEERERERKRSSSKFLSVKTCKEQRIVQVVQSTKCKMSSPFAVQATESTKIFEKT